MPALPGASGTSTIGACRLILPLLLSFLATLTFITQREFFRDSSASSSSAKALGVATDQLRFNVDADGDGGDHDESMVYSLDESKLVSKAIFPSVTGAEDVGTSTSIFNCDGAMGLCEYFYPTKFFHATKGPGKDYRFVLEKIQDLRNKNELWLNMPRVGWPTFSFSPDIVNPNTNEPFRKQNVSFLHVHKAGGTTIHSYMLLARRLGVSVQRHYVYHWAQAKSLAVASGVNANAARLQKAIDTEREKMELMYYHLSTAGKYRANDDAWGPNDHLLFAVLRDPLDRFVSSMGQAMGASGSTNNVIGKQLMKLCDKGVTYSKENSNKVAQCIVNYVKEHGYDCEIHFTPQSVEVAFATQMHHVPVAMFKFEEHYKEVLKELGANPDKKHRNGDDKGYRPSAVLREMHSTDFEPELVKDICELYKVDVIMLRTLGHSVPRCNPYIPE